MDGRYWVGANKTFGSYRTCLELNGNTVVKWNKNNQTEIESYEPASCFNPIIKFEI